MLTYLLSRLKEPSTYAGIPAILAGIGLHFSPAQLNAGTSAVMALAGLAAVLLPEAKAETRIVLASDLRPGETQKKQ